jgi:hypothetical protein
MNIKINWDSLGIFTSILCAIHCGVLPLLLPALPLFGVNIIHNSIFEWGMILIAFFVGIYSLYHGYIKHHHTYSPFIFFLSGILLLIAKQFFVEQEILLLCLAVILIISAHFMNFTFSRKSKCNSPHHKH